MAKKSTLPLKVAKSFRKKREALKMSQEAFADELGVHRTYYGAVERGMKDIRLSTLERICKALGVRMSEIFKDIEG